MGGSTSKQAIKAESVKEITEVSTGTHLIEIHMPSMGVGVMVVTMVVVACLAGWMCWRRMRRPGHRRRARPEWFEGVPWAQPMPLPMHMPMPMHLNQMHMMPMGPHLPMGHQMGQQPVQAPAAPMGLGMSAEAFVEAMEAQPALARRLVDVVGASRGIRPLSAPTVAPPSPPTASGVERAVGPDTPRAGV